MKRLRHILEEHAKAVNSIRLLTVERIARQIVKTISNGRKVYVCGCGGSAADAQHFAAEMVGRFNEVRDPYPVIALTTDTSIMSAVSNDFGFHNVFSRQILSHGQAGDMLIAISTSGRSLSVLLAMQVAKRNGITTILLTGDHEAGDPVLQDVDIIATVRSDSVARIQECHELILHMVSERVEQRMQSGVMRMGRKLR